MESKAKEKKPTIQTETFKGELIPEKDPLEHEPTGRYLRKNPYKTPPNDLTTKRR